MMIGTMSEEKEREYAEDPKKLWEEYHRVIAPVIVKHIYDKDKDECDT